VLMNQQERILVAVQTAAQKVADFDLEGEALSCAPDTILVGDGACLDSMGFVNFIVAVEDSIKHELGISINVSEELAGRPAGQEKPLTIHDLTVLIDELVVQGHGG
jgi:acyl carrier protein